MEVGVRFLRSTGLTEDVILRPPQNISFGKLSYRKKNKNKNQLRAIVGSSNIFMIWPTSACYKETERMCEVICRL